jgi:hypothetical protein
MNDVIFIYRTIRIGVFIQKSGYQLFFVKQLPDGRFFSNTVPFPICGCRKARHLL